jgi:hypothetical protein
MTALRDLVGAEGEAIAPALSLQPAADVLGPLAAAARGGGDGGEYALIVESVLEGYLLHYGRSRLLDTPDEDLRLLAGDYMYALGLSRLSQLGDLPAVRALADLITLSARQHAGVLPDGDWLAAVWVLTALAVGGGRWEGYEAAIGQARDGAATAAALEAEVSARASESHMELEAQHALIAFREAAETTAPR